MAGHSVVFGNPEEIERTEQVIPETYLVLYGSAYLAPGYSVHNAGSAFKLVAEGRNKISEVQHTESNCIVSFCPTDKEFFNKIKINKKIKRLDIYSHAWQHGINMGGFTGKRIIDGVEYDGDVIDWRDSVQDGGKDLRRIEMLESSYIPTSTEVSELVNLKMSSFTSDCEIYFWGCNAGGQLTNSGVHVLSNNPYLEDPKGSFAQEFANTVGKGNVYALVGKGTGAGSMFKTDKNGNNVYSDGEMLPANIALNKNNINTVTLNAMDYMKKFPL